MAQGAAVRPPEQSSGSATIADLLARSAARHPERVAMQVRRDDAWHDITYADAAQAVVELAAGLIDLGVQPGDRVAILSGTRAEWTFTDLAIAATGAIVVPIYPTNSPPECAYVLGDAGCRAVICEDATQVRKIRAVRDRLPALETVLVMQGAEAEGDAFALADVRAKGAGLDPVVVEARAAAVTRADVFTIIYTSGTTGDPKGCVLTHGNYRDVISMCGEVGMLEPDDLAYLYLPLAHSFGLLVQLVVLDTGAALAYFGGDRDRIVPELAEVRPTYFPSVPRVFEKIHQAVTGQAEPERIAAATQLGLRVRALRAAGEPVPAELQAAFDAADAQLFAKVRAIFGGRLRYGLSGAAPIDPGILEFFSACGAPVLEGYGMTETSTVAAYSTPDHHRFGSVGPVLPHMEARIAEDGELLLRGPNIFQGYAGAAAGDTAFGAVVDGWLHTGDLGRLDADGFLYITGRKKDIIITAGGKNLTPGNLERDLAKSRWVSYAVMHADRRPFPVAIVALDPAEVGAYAREHGLPEDLAALARAPEIHALVQADLDVVNQAYAPPEQVKRFHVLDHDFSQATGELTPTLKVRRAAIEQAYRAELDALYAE
jgi:long-chain acyl-CoA synthetase